MQIWHININMFIPRYVHVLGWTHIYIDIYICISSVNITEGHTYLGMNLFILIFIIPSIYMCEYYRGTYISWDEYIYIDIYICISSLNITVGHTYLGMNLFLLKLITPCGNGVEKCHKYIQPKFWFFICTYVPSFIFRKN